MKVLIEAHVFCAQAGLARVSGRSIFSLLGWGSSAVRPTGGASITYRQYGWSMVVSRPPTMPTQA